MTNIFDTKGVLKFVHQEGKRGGGGGRNIFTFLVGGSGGYDNVDVDKDRDVSEANFFLSQQSKQALSSPQELEL